MDERDFYSALWKYFEIHSAQRIKMMNFYLIIESLFITGLITLFNCEKEMKIVELGICGAIIFFSIIFWGFDKRTKEMIHNCENAIKFIERKYSNKYDPTIMIFLEEETLSRMRKTWSYTKLMVTEYVFFCLFALVMAICIIYTSC